MEEADPLRAGWLAREWLGNHRLLHVEMLDGGRTAKLNGEVDVSNTDDFRSVLERLPDDGEDVALDLTDLRFMDSSGLEVLLWNGKRLNGGQLVLRGVQPNILQLLHVVGLDRMPWLSLLPEDER